VVEFLPFWRCGTLLEFALVFFGQGVRDFETLGEMASLD
jgi:hypothetical protein